MNEASYAARVTVHLPFSNQNEKLAAGHAVNYFQHTFSGTTSSKIKDPAFVGTWRYPFDDRGNYRMYIADNCLLMIDFMIDGPEKRSDIRYAVSEIKDKCREYYNKFNSAQKSFWIVVSDVEIFFSE